MVLITAMGAMSPPAVGFRRSPVAMMADRSYFATCVKGLEPVLATELQGPLVGAVGVREGHLGVHFEGGDAVGARAVLWLRSALRVMELLETEDGVTNQESLYAMTRRVAWADLLESSESTISVQAVLSGPRPKDGSMMRAGDWVCSACGALVFASKLQCFRCKASKPDESKNLTLTLTLTRTLTLTLTLTLTHTLILTLTPTLYKAPKPDESKGGGGLTHSHFTALTVKNAACDATRDARGWRPSVDTEDADLPLLLHTHRGTASLYRLLSG